MPRESPNPGPLSGDRPDLSPSLALATLAVDAVPADDFEPPLNPADFLFPALEPDELGRLAHYRVVKLLGRGGMGVVFQAEDTQLHRVVALKVILPEFAGNAAARERFLREARACAALKSDHVVTIYQVGQDRDVPFLAMEFLAGQTLDERLTPGAPLPVAEAVRIGREVADGLAAAHARGLIHRDVKPANVWLEAPAGRVKLLDFGLARAVGSRSDLTQTGRVIGTPEFMSPEQARGEVLDARSDLFSLGAVLYAVCSGRRPFPGDTVMAVLTALAVNTPPSLREGNLAVPPALSDLVDRLLQKDRANRPASAVEVRDALAAIAAGTAPLPPAPAASPASTQTLAAGPTVTIKPPVPPAPPAPPAPRRSAPVLLAAAAALVGAAALGAWSSFGSGGAHVAAPGGPPIRVGVLHSRTGTMAISERPVIDAVLLAIEKLNARGGLLGRPVEAVLADGQSDETVFARAAEKLIAEDKVCTVFGCWTSASRKAVLPVVERHDHLLVYPVQYEGVEQSPAVAYLGLAPNQQILPALRWLVGFEGKRRWFLVGSDYVFPHTAHAVIKDEAKARGCEIVGEEFLPLGGTDVAAVVRKIADSKPDLIVNTINGDTNVAFFRALRRAGVTSKSAPALSLSISEEELGALGPGDTAGDYVAANYFQTLTTPANVELLRRFGHQFGAERVVSSPMATAYVGVHLWTQAVRAAGTDDVRAIRDALRGQSYEAPYGPVKIDPATGHAVQTARVGRVDETGRLVEVYVSPQPIVPEPFPTSRSRAEWSSFLDGLHQRWGGRWSNPGP
jgi:urea transport system substrate-binding protein